MQRYLPSSDEGKAGGTTLIVSDTSPTVPTAPWLSAACNVMETVHNVFGRTDLMGMEARPMSWCLQHDSVGAGRAVPQTHQGTKVCKPTRTMPLWPPGAVTVTRDTAIYHNCKYHPPLTSPWQHTDDPDAARHRKPPTHTEPTHRVPQAVNQSRRRVTSMHTPPAPGNARSYYLHHVNMRRQAPLRPAQHATRTVPRRH